MKRNMPSLKQFLQTRKQKPPVRQFNAQTAQATAEQVGRSFEEEEESDAPLGAAFAIVLLLHVIAIVGVVAFSQLQGNGEPKSPTASRAATTLPAKTVPEPRRSVQVPEPPAKQTSTDTTSPKPSPPVTAAALGVPTQLPMTPPRVTEQPAKATQTQPPRQPETAAPVTKPKPPAVAAKTTPYTVRPKDTAMSIARAHGIKLEDLKKANNIPDLDKLTPGQTLRIPRKG
jgi:LysM repeat protein